MPGGRGRSIRKSRSLSVTEAICAQTYTTYARIWLCSAKLSALRRTLSASHLARGSAVDGVRSGGARPLQQGFPPDRFCAAPVSQEPVERVGFPLRCAGKPSQMSRVDAIVPELREDGLDLPLVRRRIVGRPSTLVVERTKQRVLGLPHTCANDRSTRERLRRCALFPRQAFSGAAQTRQDINKRRVKLVPGEPGVKPMPRGVGSNPLATGPRTRPGAPR